MLAVVGVVVIVVIVVAAVVTTYKKRNREGIYIGSNNTNPIQSVLSVIELHNSFLLTNISGQSENHNSKRYTILMN